MQYDLVFEGGGAKGTVFVGALQVFEELGHRPGRLLGTSAGAITATMVAAGYTSQEMLAALAEKIDGRSVFAGFLGLPQGIDQTEIARSATRALLEQVNLRFVPDQFERVLDDLAAAWLLVQPGLRHIFSFIERGGWFGADSFLAWLAHRLDSGELNGRPRQFSGLSLAQLNAETGVDLSLIAADTIAGRMLVLNHRTAPNLPVVWAVRMSMGVPLLWQEVIWREEWGRYQNQDLSGHAVVDGGLLSNFPIELFVSHDVTVTSVMGPKTSEAVLGMLIDESAPVPGVALAALPPAVDHLGQLRTVQRLGHLLNTLLSARDQRVTDVFEQFVVRLPAKGYGTVEFDMTDERREALVDAGRQAMRAYFASAPAGLDLSGLTTGGLATATGAAGAVPARDEIDRQQRAANKVALRILAM